MSRTTQLRATLKTRFFPFAQERGFSIGKSTPNFTTFRRVVGDQVHVFDIQWDKYGTPRFVLNFGAAPSSGLERNGKPLSPGQVEVYDCATKLRLQRSRGGSMGCWFQLRKPLLEQIASLTREYTPEEVVQSVIETFPEIEAWWSSGAMGPHVHGLL